MEELNRQETTRSTTTTRSAQTGLSRKQTSSAPVQHVSSHQFLDNQSVYHGDEHHYPDFPEGEYVQEQGGSDGYEGRSDSEKTGDGGSPAPTPHRYRSRSMRSSRDPKLVTWDGPDDLSNPKNWSTKRKWLATGMVSSFTFISPVSSSMVAPALASIATEFGIENEIESQLTLSIFILAYAFGPLLLGPLSEIYGRVIVLQLSNLFYLVFNIACGVSQSKGQLTAFRFLSGLGGSAPLAVGGGVLGDCWKADERGKGVAIYTLAPLLGPAIGPIAGGFITKYTTWRWAFYATSIADAVIQIAGLFLLQETYGPVLLKRKAAKLRKETNDESFFTEFDHPEKSGAHIIRTALVRPFIMITTQPIIQAIALYMAFLYGLMYLTLATFPALWTSPHYYNEPIHIGSLNYISIGIGFFLGSQIGSRCNDRCYRHFKIKNGGIGKPEHRTPLLIGSAILTPAGLFIYGWTAHSQTHWIGPNIGAGTLAAGIIVGFQCMQSYIVDAYTRFAASGIAAATLLRSLAGFSFPLFAPYMYDALGYGWGNSLLGFVAIAFGCPAPFFLWKYGELLRRKSPYAAGS